MNDLKNFENQSKIISPKLSSTLKRSNGDIKLTLVNILSKESNEILLKISGANIEHNVNNVNKHGVVINTDDDLPIWVVRAMHTLLNWESDNDCEYPKFSDVYQEIVDYFNNLGYCLLTNELSGLFLEIFDIMFFKSNEILKPKSIQDDDQVCLNHRILDLIVSSADQIINETNFKNKNDFLLENIEKHLLENAKLNIFDDEMMDNFDIDRKKTHCQEFYLSLLMDSLAKLENCCSKCKKIYDETNEYLSIECNKLILDNDENDFSKIKRKKLNDPMSITTSCHLESKSKRLHRNNSFRAAISTTSNTKKPLVVRSSTTNSNDFSRSFLTGKGELVQDDECDTFDLNSLQFDNPWKNLKKSISTQNLCEDMNNISKTARKRKASSEKCSNVEQLIMAFSGLNKQEEQTRFGPSVSFSSIDTTRQFDSKKISSSMSLQIISNEPTQQTVNKNINEINSFIRKSLVKNLTYEIENKNVSDNLLTTEIDSDIFFYMISSFRLLALMMPPANKRKLHFLLRFLNKLKYTKNIDEYLLSHTRDKTQDDFQYIDVSLSNEANQTSRHKIEQKTSQEIECVLIKSFLKSIIETGEEHESSKRVEYASKLVQILINNYSEIMRIPEDLVTNFKQRLKSVNSRDKNVSLVRSRKEFSSSNDELNKLSDTSLKPSKTNGFRNFVDSMEKKSSSAPNAFNQNQKIKKALNVLGLNDSISYKHVDSLETKESMFTASLNEKTTNQFLSDQSIIGLHNQSSMTNSNFLNSSTLSAYPSISSIFQSTSSINFPRIFSNKKWKKENLI